MNTFRALRERLGLTQDSLAKSLGVTQGNVAHYERGQTVPPDIARLLIARAKELGHDVTFDDVYAVDPPLVKPNTRKEAKQRTRTTN